MREYERVREKYVRVTICESKGKEREREKVRERERERERTRESKHCAGDREIRSPIQSIEITRETDKFPKIAAPQRKSVPLKS